EGRRDAQRLVEPHQSVEELLNDGQAIGVADSRGVERGRIVPERPAVGAAGPRWARAPGPLLGEGRVPSRAREQEQAGQGQAGASPRPPPDEDAQRTSPATGPRGPTRPPRRSPSVSGAAGTA